MKKHSLFKDQMTKGIIKSSVVKTIEIKELNTTRHRIFPFHRPITKMLES